MFGLALWYANLINLLPPTFLVFKNICDQPNYTRVFSKQAVFFSLEKSPGNEVDIQSKNQSEMFKLKPLFGFSWVKLTHTDT